MFSKIFSILVMLFKCATWFVKRSEKKQKIKTEAADVIKQGIKENDPSKITAGFDRINNA